MGSLIRIVVSLGLGLAASLAIAGAVAWSAPSPTGGRTQYRLGPVPGAERWAWYVTPRRSFGHEAWVFRKGLESTDAPPLAESDLPGWASVPGSGMRVDVQGFGWPLRCVRLVWESPAGVHDGWEIGGRRLPGHPLWLGLAADTVVWGALAWGALTGAGAARRALRRWRGRCPACAYPVVGLERCPECGRA